MKHSFKGYELELIDEPLQGHVVAWEKAVRALKSEDAKPILNELQETFHSVDAANFDVKVMLGNFMTAAKLLKEALEILEKNETLTVTANHGVMVKGAIAGGWVLAFTKDGAPIAPKPEDVDQLPSWLVTWAATQVALLYNEATTIPKN